MGIPESVTRDTCQQFRCSADNYHRGFGGRLGMHRGPLHWVTHYLAGRLFRFDRFEFKLEPFRPHCQVYRHSETGQVVALAADGVRYTNDGFVVRPDATEMPEKAWTASLEAVDTVVKGYPISPRGVAIQRRVSLSLSQWECLTRPESYTMDMHIPAGGDMTPERCVNSFRKGVEFFRRFFPNKPFQTVSSASWIFGPQLEEILPPEANLVRHMRELYLFPLPCGPDAGLWFVFLLHPVDPTTAPRDTSLRRAVADYLAEGKPWYAGGMFFVVDDLGLYGTQHYRTQWPDVLRAVE